MIKILLTNDDGIYAPGLWALYDRLAASHSVAVVAPDRERSAVGHGLTLHTPLRVETVHVNGKGPFYSVTGTPADCVKLGLIELLEEKPDLVVSGINPGANVGVNINYSGTVAGAKEAALYGIHAIAVSIKGPDCRFIDDAAAYAEKIADQVVQNGLPLGTFLNVNIPNLALKDMKGIRISRQGIKFYDEYFKKRVDPRDREYYWHGSFTDPVYEDPDIDGQAVCDNYISITPIKCDMTDYPLMETLKTWALKTQTR